MPLTPIAETVEEWRKEAARFERRGFREPAELLRSCAEELESAWREHLEEPLSPAQGAKESGYTSDHIRRLLRDGTLPNAGGKNSPRVRRRYLPRKPGHTPLSDENSPANADKPDVPSPTQMARSVVESERGDDDGER